MFLFLGCYLGSMRVDSQVVLAGAILIYALFLGTGAANLYGAGYLNTSQAFVVVSTALYVAVLSLLYIVYHGVYDMSKTIGSYEDADMRAVAFWTVAGVLFLYVLYALRAYVPFSASAYVQTVLNLIYVAPIFVGLAENMGFIAVIGDYVYDRTKNALLAGFLVGFIAVITHATLPLVVPTFSFLVLILQFAFWTYASIQSRSTLPADILHVVNNALFLLRV